MTGNGCTGNSGGMLAGSGTEEDWELEELQGPGRRSRKGGREKQKRVRVKSY